MGKTHEYRLEGLDCASCAAKFEKNVRALPEVKDVKLNFGAAKLTVIGEASVESLEEAGAFDHIKVKDIKEEVGEASLLQRHEMITMLASLPFLLAGWIVVFQLGEDALLAKVLFGLSIAIGGYRLLGQGIKNLTTFTFDMKTLMTIAIIGAAVIGEWGEGAVVVFLFAISEVLERFSMERARRSIRSLMSIAPKQAAVIENGQEVMKAVKEVRVGDRIRIRPGQSIPLDGTVLHGHSHVNQAAITGESIPVEKRTGDTLFAGTMNEQGALEVEVTTLVEDTAIAKMIHLVEEAQAEKAPSQAFVDRFAAYYTPAIMIVALLVATMPPLVMGGDWTEWIYRGLAVLVVGCPCALVISTPVAIVTAIGYAAKNGVLIKGGVHLEQAGKITAVAFDKTGTLTKGEPSVREIVSFDGTPEDSIAAYAAAIERSSAHPLAKAVVHWADEKELPQYTITDFHSITGKGVEAKIDGVRYRIGRPETPVAPEHAGQIEQLQKNGNTVIHIMREQTVIGIIAAADTVRKESADVIRKLKKIGVKRSMMITGDHPFAAEAIAASINVTDVKAQQMPDQKLEVIRSLQQQGEKVAMIGDGVNDAPALALADTAIAMGGAGTDTALETADIALMSDDLTKIPFTIGLSKRTMRIILQNVTLALGLKIAALLLIIPGWLTLWLAIFADVGATLLVVANSLRLMKGND